MTRSARDYATWLKTIKTCGDLYTQRDCGCLVVIMYDEPWTIEMCREDFVSEALAGRMFHRAAPGQLPPLNCAEHEPAGAAR